MTPLEHARIYAQWGWPVIPILPGTKRPAMVDWVRAATTDDTLITEWWTANPQHGVGIVTGERSNLFVLDVDPAHGGDESLAELEAQHGPLPPTVESITGSGGRHLLFRWPGFNPRTGANRLGPGLDIRAEGGQIVAPPSIHPQTTQRYAWEWDSDPFQGVAPQDAPAWLLDLLREPERDQQPRAERTPVSDADRPGDRFAASTTWPELLLADGATLVATRTDRHGHGYELWARPGKAARDGASATLYYGGTDLLKVFTSNWPGLTEGDTYTKFGYFAATRFNNDHSAAARKLAEHEQNNSVEEWLRNALHTPVGPIVGDDNEEPDDLRRMLINWDAFWQQDFDGEDWLIHNIIAAGRSHALYAPAKAGKSLFILDIVAALASGAALLGEPNERGPISVLYLDYEMAQADLYARLTDMGYGPQSDLSMLHYASLPPLPALDTFAGGATVLRLAQSVNAELVIIDTIGRAVEGEENSADTIRGFYRCTGLLLKAAGIAVVRTDHAGKDQEKGQRGSSAKNDDVDIVWRLQTADRKLVTLTRTYSRIGAGPDRIQIERRVDPLRHVVSHTGYPAGTKSTADALQRHDIAPSVGIRRAHQLLKEAGYEATRAQVEAAQRWRQENDWLHAATEALGTTPNEALGTTPNEALGTTP